MRAVHARRSRQLTSPDGVLDLRRVEGTRSVLHENGRNVFINQESPSRKSATSAGSLYVLRFWTSAEP